MRHAFSLEIGLVMLAFGVPAKATCYTVYRDSTVLFQSTRAPVDMSQPISVTVPAKFGEGATMTFTGSSACQEVSMPTHPGGDAIATTGRGTRASATLRVPSSATLDPGQFVSSAQEINGLADDRSGAGSGSSDVHVGPRGGRYTLTPSGNKSYLSSHTSRGNNSHK